MVEKHKNGLQIGISVFLTLGALFLAGCKREEIRVYTAPKDPPPHEAEMASERTVRPRPKITYTLPKDWKVVPPSQVSFVSFEVKGPSGKEANVSITRLANLEGKEPELVNMWRQMAGLKELGREEALKQFQPVEVAGGKGSLFETSSETNDLRIVTAIMHQPDGSWFYKLSGDAAVVDKEKPAFLDFLKSVHVEEALSEAKSGGPAGQFEWTIPPGWKTVPPGQMQVAKFVVPERGKAKGEVFVSMFDSASGGHLLNVNRWRKQIKLPEISESELSKVISPLDPALPGSILVDMTNSDKRLVGAIVPRDDQYWFYKLLGDTEAVTPEKEAFVLFAKSKP